MRLKRLYRPSSRVRHNADNIWRTEMLLRFSLILVISLVSVGTVSAQSSGLPKEWVLTTDLYGNPLKQQLSLSPQSGHLSGTLDGDPITGSISEDHIHFIATGKRHNSVEVDVVLTSANEISGKVAFGNSSSSHPTTFSVSGRAIESRPLGSPRTVEFRPTKYYNLFSADIPPVLTIWPGDTIHTKTIDSGGVDENGITQALSGNPQTGPFFVGGAESGDVLAVHIKRLKINRNYADSLDAIAERVMNSDLSIKAKDLGQRIRWKIDADRGVAYPDVSPANHLKEFTVPLKPMLGCVGVAPAFGFAAFSTGEEGRYGGNLDFNEITEGATVYLNVTQPGALLYIGDAHAAMGDGETTEWGLETSMDVEFSVEVLKNRFISTPRVETATHKAAVGVAGSVDEAMRRATSGMVQWLQQDYGLSISEVALVLGSSAEYRISEIADRDASVVLLLKKELLIKLQGIPANK
jgi:amidase